MMIYQSGVLNVSIDKDLETSVNGRTQVKDPFINSEMDKVEKKLTENVDRTAEATQRLEAAITEQNSQTKSLYKKVNDNLKDTITLINSSSDRVGINLTKLTKDLVNLFVLYSASIIVIEIAVSYFLLKFSFDYMFITDFFFIVVGQELVLHFLYKKHKQLIVNIKNEVQKMSSKASENNLEELSEKNDLFSSTAISKERTNGLKTLLLNLKDVAKNVIPPVRVAVSIYDLHQRKEFFISKVRYSLTRYNFKIDDVVDNVLSPYSITSESEQSWLKQIISILGSIIKLGENVIGVILSESEFFQNNLRQFLLNMQDEDFVNLSIVLVNHKVINSTLVYDEEILQRLVQLSLKKLKESYSLNRVQKTIVDLENKYLSFFEQINEISSLFYIDNLPSLADILKFIPDDMNDIIGDLYMLSSKKSNVDIEIIKLFRSALTSPNHGKLLRSYVEKSCDIKKLAKFLVIRQEITFGLDNISVENILKNPDWLDLYNLKSLFKIFKENFQVIEEYKNFLHAQGFRPKSINFSDLVPLFPHNFNSMTADIFENLAYPLIDIEEDVFKIEKPSINLAASSIFIYEKAPFGTELFQIYKKAASDQDALKILYCRALLFDNEQTNNVSVKLSDAIKKAQKPEEQESFRYLRDYQEHLRANHVYSSIKNMAEGRVSEASKIIEENSWSKYYSKMSDHIRTFFGARIGTEVSSLLKYNIVRAYLISSPSQFPLMETLDPKNSNFQNIINELEENEPDYGELRRIKAGTGNSTRVIVISPKVDFEKFTSMLDKAINNYAERYLKEKRKRLPYAFAMRLYTSSEFMGVIPGKTEEMNELNKLILKSMEELGPSEQMSIVAASRSEGTVGRTLNSINLELLNQNEVDIFEFTDKEGALRDRLNKLGIRFKNSVQEELLKEFGISGVGDLCKYLSEKSDDTETNKRFMDAFTRGSKYFKREKFVLPKDLIFNLLDELQAIGAMLTI